nr:hypothetical protein DA06_07150 [Georgenia sp. SUBG003]
MNAMPTGRADAARSAEARLLVVDDEPSIRELLSASLRFAGFDVVTAEDGNAALRAASQQPPRPRGARRDAARHGRLHRPAAAACAR